MENIEEKDKQSKYDNMGIVELRVYARLIGVKRSTTKKRQELIDSIIAIENGEVEPHNNFSIGKGRPPKSFAELKVISSMDGKQLEIENRKLKQILRCVYEIVKEFK